MADKALCKIEGCGKSVKSRGWCALHYVRWWTYGDPEPSHILRQTAGHGRCGIEGCNNSGKLTRGWCAKHYQRWQDNGDPLKSKYNREQTGKLCKVTSCSNTSGYHGYCQTHWTRILRTGDPHNPSLSARYRHVEKWMKQHVSYSKRACLEWPFKISPNGNGRPSAQGMNAARAMCILAHGMPPKPRLHAAHYCGNGKCMNPKHIRWATAKENAADKVSHGTDPRTLAKCRSKTSKRP